MIAPRIAVRIGTPPDHRIAGDHKVQQVHHHKDADHPQDDRPDNAIRPRAHDPFRNNGGNGRNHQIDQQIDKTNRAMC
jgi:hypothetical protein